MKKLQREHLLHKRRGKNQHEKRKGQKPNDDLAEIPESTHKKDFQLIRPDPTEEAEMDIQ